MAALNSPVCSTAYALAVVCGADSAICLRASYAVPVAYVATTYLRNARGTDPFHMRGTSEQQHVLRLFDANRRAAKAAERGPVVSRRFGAEWHGTPAVRRRRTGVNRCVSARETAGEPL
eukprot:973745-Rhodomonas_salina.1